MHVVASSVDKLSVLRARHSDDLRSTGVLRDLDNVTLVGHVLIAIFAEGLSLQLIGAVFQERYGSSECAAVWQLLISHCPVFGLAAHLSDQAPGISALAAVAQSQTP